MKMNRMLAVACLSAAVPGMAWADVQVYGKFNVGLENQQDEIGLDKKYADHTWVFKDQNNSSRLGVKGDQDIGLAGLKVIYQLEYGVDPDGSEGTPFSERNIFVGLQSDTYGTAMFGKFDTPVKKAGAKADLFDDESLGDDTNLLVGETRQSNMIQYNTPKLFDALTVTAAVSPGEGRTSVDDVDDQDHGVADTWYASLVYDTKPLYAAVAYAHHEASALKFDDAGVMTGKTAAVNILRLTAYTAPIDHLELGALYQQAEGVDQRGGAVDGGDAKEKSWLVSAGYTIAAFKLKAQYGQTKGDLSDFKRSGLSLGVDYKLSKSMMAQLYRIAYRQDAASGHDPKSNATGLGLIYVF